MQAGKDLTQQTWAMTVAILVLIIVFNITQIFALVANSLKLTGSIFTNLSGGSNY